MEQYWSEYWQAGHLTSFGHMNRDNYEGCIKKTWVETFSTIGNDSIVLDIACGNGALLDMAFSCNPYLTLIGIDSAVLTLSDHLKNNDKIDCLSNVKAEALPFTDQKFDVLVSQFGIEYADLSVALLEVARVLKPNGKFKFVMHHSGSSIVKPNHTILTAANDLLIKKGVLYQLRDLITFLEKYGQVSTKTDRCRNELNKQIYQIAKHNERGLVGTNFPEFLQATMSPKLGFPERRKKFDEFKTELDGLIQRLSDLTQAALTDSKYKTVKERLNNVGLTITEDYVLMDNATLIGYVLAGEKL